VFALLALGVAACAQRTPDRPIDTVTAYECRRQAMAASNENWPVERSLYAQCLHDHGN